MSVKSYLSVCGLFAFAVLLAFVTGNLTMFSSLIFGFVFLGLTFMGMMNVLPIYVMHANERIPVEPEPVAKPVAVTESPAPAFQVFKSA